MIKVHECLWLCTCHHMRGLCVCAHVCVEWQGHASWATWIYLGQTRGPHVCLSSGASEPPTEGASSQLTPELVPAWDQPLSLSLSLSLSLYSYLYCSLHPCCLFSHFLSPTLCILATSLPGHGLAYFYLSHSGPFDVDHVGPFHRSCACLQMAPLLNPQSVYEYTFHKQDM